MKEKKIILFLIFILLVSISCSDKKNSNSTEKNSVVENATSSSSNNADSNKKQEITIVGVGDIMLGSNYPNKSLLPNENILKNTESILKDADIAVGNLEGTLFDSGGTPKSCSNPKVCYVFRTPSSYGKYFKEAGFDYLSIANNHSNDFGHKGIVETIKNLDLLEKKKRYSLLIAIMSAPYFLLIPFGNILNFIIMILYSV